MLSFPSRNRFIFKHVLLLVVFIPVQSTAQYLDAGIELQQYPTGTVLTLRMNAPSSKALEATFRLGANIIYHRDLGVHDNEQGLGFGFSVGGRYWLNEEKHGLHVGVRSDFWYNRIDWYDDLEGGGRVDGQSDVFVVQPTAFVGWDLGLNDSWRLVPSVALGAEINAWQDGEDTGQGAILLLGVQLVRRSTKQ